MAGVHTTGRELRHGFVTDCLSLGVPPHLVMEMTGHTSLDALSAYVRLLNSHEALGFLLYLDRLLAEGELPPLGELPALED